MKVNFLEQKQKSNWISTTGYRIFIELKSLLESPKTADELIEIIKNNSFLGKKISKDTVRFDINTLKAAGCSISKPSKNNGYKYQLIYHPFKLNISAQELDIFFELRENLCADISVNEVFILNDLYDKIIALTFDNNLIEETANTRILSDIDRNLFMELSNPKLTGKKVQIKYKSPKYDYEDVDVVPIKIVYENKKVYLCAYNYKYKANSLFEMSKIKNINFVSFSNEDILSPVFNVLYAVNNEAVNDFELKSYEKIIERYDNKIVIEAAVSNEFMFIQRLLLLGRNFYIIKPDTFRKKLIEKIKSIQKRYCDD